LPFHLLHFPIAPTRFWIGHHSVDYVSHWTWNFSKKNFFHHLELTPLDVILYISSYFLFFLIRIFRKICYLVKFFFKIYKGTQFNIGPSLSFWDTICIKIYRICEISEWFKGSLLNHQLPSTFVHLIQWRSHTRI
jgi:hypothetical protein